MTHSERRGSGALGSAAAASCAEHAADHLNALHESGAFLAIGHDLRVSPTDTARSVRSPLRAV